MTSSPTATPRNRPEIFGPPSPSGSGPWASSCTPTRRRSCTARTRTAGGDSEHTSFDFLGYTFRGRLARGRRGFFVSFSPAMSAKARKAVGQKIRAWHLNRRSGTDLSGLAEDINPQVRGWINYYGAFYRSELYSLARRIDEHLVRWAMHKFKRLRGRPAQGVGLAGRCPPATAQALRPLAPAPAHRRPACGSRMTGDCHVRFCESRGVRFPPATHQTPPTSRELAGPPPPLPRALHADLRVVDQPSRTVVLPPHHPETPSRHPHQNSDSRRRHPRVDHRMERRPQTVRLDQDRRRNPRPPRHISTANSWRRALGAPSAHSSSHFGR